MLYVWISLGISIAGLFASIGVSTFIAGMRVGVVQTDIAYLKRDMATIMHYFKLTPAEERNGRGRR